MKAGDAVVVVFTHDAKWVDRLVGCRGFVVEKLPYQECGDDPEADPMYLVDFGPEGAGSFWSEELEFQGH